MAEKLETHASYSFGVKTEDYKSFVTPAPGSYQPEKFRLDKNISYTFGSKLNIDKPNDTPGNCL